MKTQPLTRRSFLKSSAMTFAAASIAPAFLNRASAATASKQRDIKKAIMYATVGVKGSVLEKFHAVKDAGFGGIEPMGGMDQKEVLEAFAATGLKAASVCCHSHWDKPLSSADPATRQIGLDGLKQSLRDAKAYGATSVLLVPGVARGGVSYDECFQRSIVEIKKAIPLAAELGVKIAIENVWNDFVTTPQQADAYLKAIDSPQVGWHFDIGNVGRYSPAEQWIPIIGKRILKLHIKEFDTRKMTKEKPGSGFDAKFLEGTNDWPAIMKALDAIGYAGWGIAEQGGGGTPEGLKDLAERMDRIFAS
ncbi:MAG: sugar phosphate isomerase/epimerase [Verrucomicrobia bacterium]|nr:sugar phosphate isomerase/epimerase [Verrucomicrobiota bacterium]